MLDGGCILEKKFILDVVAIDIADILLVGLDFVDSWLNIYILNSWSKAQVPPHHRQAGQQS